MTEIEIWRSMLELLTLPQNLELTPPPLSESSSSLITDRV